MIRKNAGTIYITTGSFYALFKVFNETFGIKHNFHEITDSLCSEYYISHEILAQELIYGMNKLNCLKTLLLFLWHTTQCWFAVLKKTKNF